MGAVGYAVYERFLQSAGKTMLSTIAQVSGAVIDIFGDWLLIHVFELGVAGAAIATVVGQIAFLVIAMAFHYFKNKEINGNQSTFARAGKSLRRFIKSAYLQ